MFVCLGFFNVIFLSIYHRPTPAEAPCAGPVEVSLAWGWQVSPEHGRELSCGVGQLAHATSSLSHGIQGFSQLEDLEARLSLAVSSYPLTSLLLFLQWVECLPILPPYLTESQL